MTQRAGSAARVAAENRKARFNYFIDETFEAGIALTGTEVKSLREGRASSAEAYAAPEAGEIFLVNAYIPEYSHAAVRAQHEPRRPRRLLLHAREISRLMGAVEREGMTLIPLKSISRRGGARRSSSRSPAARSSTTSARRSASASGTAPRRASCGRRARGCASRPRPLRHWGSSATS